MPHFAALVSFTKIEGPVMKNSSSYCIVQRKIEGILHILYIPALSKTASLGIVADPAGKSKMS